MVRLAIPGSDVFDGRLVTTDIIPAGDALVYLGRAQDVGKASRDANDEAMQINSRADHAQTTIRFSLQQPESVELHIYDVRGRLVRQLQPAAVLQAGDHEFLWSQQDSRNRRVSPGIYFMKLRTSHAEQRHKLVVTH